MNYTEVLSYLHSVDYTMERYEREDFDRFVKKEKVELSVPSIHITGSNGKGSVAHYLEAIYLASGYHVGLFSSPFAYKPNEMIRVDGKDISDADFAATFSSKEEAITKGNLSSFEIETFIAFTYFSKKGVDIAIIEAGMGGEGDSTNIITPILSIITSVSLEHTEFLGTSVSEITENKAGIVKKRVPLLIGKLGDSALSVVRKKCKEMNSELVTVDDFHNEHYLTPHFRFDYRPYYDLAILNPAKYLIEDAVIATEAVKTLSSSFPVDELDLRKGLLVEPLMCRFERHRNIFIDGAHNPEAIEDLTTAIVNVAEGRPIHVVFASFRDKNIAVMLPVLGKDAADIALTTFSHPRARSEMDYFLYEADYHYWEDYKMAVRDLIANHPDDCILVTGSLAFAYEVRRFVIEELHL